MPICKCGRQIAFGKTPEGKFIPLDMVAPVYGDATHESELESGKMSIVRLPNAYVTHFATCKFASDFSRQRHEPIKEGQVVHLEKTDRPPPPVPPAPPPKHYDQSRRSDERVKPV